MLQLAIAIVVLIHQPKMFNELNFMTFRANIEKLLYIHNLIQVYYFL